MSSETTARARTLIDPLKMSFDRALRTPEGVVEPVALLWTDADSEWRGLIPVLRAALPQLYILGPYDPENHSGPAIWLKCIVDRSLPDISPKPGVVPILYFPGVSRQELRAAGDPRNVASEARKSLGEIDKNLPITGITTLPEQIRGRLNNKRFRSFRAFSALWRCCWRRLDCADC